MRISIFCSLLFLILSISSCNQFGLPDLSPCDEAFNYNRNVDIANQTIPYMKTCGLTVVTSKYLRDVYARDATVDQNFVDVIYGELETADRLLTEYQIPYYIIGGTMLGAIRNGGLIPNDDDIDIAIEIKHESSLLKLAREFEAEGYDLEHAPFLGYKVKQQRSRSNGLDIFITTERVVNGKRVLAYARDGAFENWPNDVVLTTSLDNLTRIRFGHLMVSSIPIADAIVVLDNLYGKDWYSVAYKDYDHVNLKPVTRHKAKILPTEYYHLVHSKTVANHDDKKSKQ